MPAKKTRLPVDPVRVEIEDVTEDNRGIASMDGKRVLVDGAVAGESVSVRFIRRRGQSYEAVVHEVHEAAAERVEPRCRHFGRCGGCSLQHLSQHRQVALKQAGLLRELQSKAQILPQHVLAPLTSHAWGYRRKARLGAKWLLKKDTALVGFRELRSNYVAALNECQVLHPDVGGRIDALRGLVGSLDARDRLPQIEVAVGDAATALVFRHLDPLSEADLARLREFAVISGLRVYLQPKGPDSVTPLWPVEPGPLHYRLSELGLSFEFEPLDFIQVNAGVNEALVASAIELLAPRRDDRVLDLFCGLGNFSLPLARSAGRVVGLEGSAELIRRARHNAQRNRIANVEYQAADLFDDQTCKAWLAEPWDKLLLDPPRSGALEIVENLSTEAPHRVVYVSCNPATLARDAEVLVNRQGFRLHSTAVVDMFPHTNHIESLNLFER